MKETKNRSQNQGAIPIKPFFNLQKCALLMISCYHDDYRTTVGTADYVSKFAQELLSTFSTSLGEVSLVPSTGGIFTIEIVHCASGSSSSPSSTVSTRLWDRKTEGGFPEVKHLKQLVRDVIDPGRDLGHVDRNRREKVGNYEQEMIGKGDLIEIEAERSDKVAGGIGVLDASKKPSGENVGVAESFFVEGTPKHGAESNENEKESCQDCD